LFLALERKDASFIEIVVKDANTVDEMKEKV
jgi:hypothetical protein